MAQSWSNWCWQLGLASFLAMGGAIAFSRDCTLAQQIVPDTTLGAESSVVVPKANINSLPSDQIDGGAIRGPNLFHSFQKFNIDAERGAYFTNPTGIENVLSRVTGGSRSNIFGKLGVLGNANLFLINPNGIIFGPNASLDVRGSFVATTANAVRLGETGIFSASEPATSNLLTVRPSALFFNAVAAQAIVNQSQAQSLIGQPNSFDGPVGLQVPMSQTLALVGGDIVLNGGNLAAAGGRIELGSVAGVGEVSLSQIGNSWLLGYNLIDAFGNIRLEGGAFVNSTGEGGGNIQLQGAQLEMTQGARIYADTRGTGAGGEVLVLTTKAVTLSDGSQITTDLLDTGTGTGGDVTIKTEQLSVQGNGSRVRTGNFGKGQGGNLTVNASESVEMAGSSSSGLFTQTLGAGAAGNLTITTRRLSVQDGARISTSTSSTSKEGQGGDLSVTAFDSVKLSGSSGLFSQTQGAGDAGALKVVTRQLSIQNGAVVSAGTGTNSEGKGGDLTVRASDSVALIGTRTLPDGRQVDSGLYTQTQGAGDAGNLRVETERLTVRDEARVSVAGYGSGNAGNLEVQARSISLDNKGQLIATNSSVKGGGDITLHVQDLLLLRRGSNISTTTGTAGAGGNGGNITINNTPFIVAVPLEDSNIEANAYEGNGGRVDITAQGIYGFQLPEEPTLLSDITATSELGPQFNGTVEIRTPDDVDPSHGLVTLPAELVDVTGLIAQACPAGGGSVVGSEFIVTGRGGLPPSPSETLSSDTVWVDLRPTTVPAANQLSGAIAPQSSHPTAVPVVEAQGWVIDDNGKVVLTATAPTVTSHIPWLKPAACHGS